MSIDTCILYVKGTPGGIRKIRKDREGTVRSFCVDMDQLYRAVYNHVKKCPTCEPNDVLRQYIANRHIKKFVYKGGIVSRGLIQLAEKYSRLKNKKVDPEILREFRWRCGDFYGLINDRSLLTSEVIKGLNLVFGITREIFTKGGGVKEKGEIFSAVDYVRDRLGLVTWGPHHSQCLLEKAAEIWDLEGEVTPESEAIRELLVIADVIAS